MRHSILKFLKHKNLDKSKKKGKKEKEKKKTANQKRGGKPIRMTANFPQIIAEARQKWHNSF